MLSIPRGGVVVGAAIAQELACAPKAVEALGNMPVVLVSLSIPPQFLAVSQFYHTFKQVDDDEVLSLLCDSVYVTNVNE